MLPPQRNFLPRSRVLTRGKKWRRREKSGELVGGVGEKMKLKRDFVHGKQDGGDEEGGGDHPQCVEEVGVRMVCGREGVIKINLLLIYSFLRLTCFDFIDIVLNIN